MQVFLRVTSSFRPVRVPGHNAPSSHLLILALYILFACLHCLLPPLILFFTFFLTYLLPYLSFPLRILVSDIAIFVLKRDVKLQLTNFENTPDVSRPDVVKED